MARNEIDPIAFTREDEAMGAMTPHRDPRGVVRIKKRRWAGGVRDKMTQAQMKADMAALWREGEDYAKIAEKVNEKWNLAEQNQAITAHTIHYHIKAMLDFWRQKAAARIDERQAAILARFDQLEALALEAYWASCEGRSTRQKNKQIIRAKSEERMGQHVKKEIDKRDKLFDGRNTEKTRNAKFSWAEDGDLEALEDSLSEVQERIQNNFRTETNQAGDVKFLSLVFQINRERAKILGLYQKRDVEDASGQAAMMSDEQREQRVLSILKTARERREAQANMLAEPAPLGGFQVEDDPEKVVISKIDPDEVDNEEEEEITWDDIDEVEEPKEIEWD